MTAILGCCYAGAPLLFGDVIESIESRAEYLPNPYPYIPSVGSVNVSPNPGSQYRISGLVQKISIIGPNLALAWCGDVKLAKDILERIRDANDIQPFDYATLTRLLDHDSPSLASGDVGLIVLLKDGMGLTMFAKNVQDFPDATFSLIWAGGTGLDSLLANLGSHRVGVHCSNPVLSAISLGASLSGSLITHEVHHLDSLRLGYGGTYEIATLIDGVCAKVSEIMNVLWFGKINKDGFSLRLPNRIFHNSYWNDLLIVRSLTIADGLVDQQRDEYTLIPPVFRKITSDDIRLAPIPLFNSPTVAHHITFRGLDGKVRTVSKVGFGNVPGFNIVETSLPNDKHKIEIHIDDEFINRTSDEIYQLMKRDG